VFKLIPALAIFFGSYFPLFLILLAQGIDWPIIDFPCEFDWTTWPEIRITDWRVPTFPVLFSFVSLFCVGGTLYFLRNRRLGLSIEVTSSKPMASELMGYVLPYVVSFMGLDFSDTGRVIGFVIFLGWLFILTYRSGQILMNPALIVFGYRLHEIEYYYIGAPDTSYTSATLHKGSAKFVLGPHNAQEIENIIIIREKDADNGD